MLERGATVGEYKVREHLATGALGEVYTAVHPTTGDKVAIKVFHRHLTRDSDGVAAFEEEVWRVARLDHPGIVRLIQVGRLEDGALYTASEFVVGQTLTDIIDRRAPLGSVQAAQLLKAIAEVLDEAHRSSFVHGGLKPDNVFTAPDKDGGWPPLVRLADLGLSRLVCGKADQARALAEGGALLCRAGAVRWRRAQRA